MAEPIQAICASADEGGLDYWLLYEPAAHGDTARVSHGAILLRPAHARRFRALLADWAAREGWATHAASRRKFGWQSLRLAKAASPGGVALLGIDLITARRNAALGPIDGRKLLAARETIEGVSQLPPERRAAVAHLLADFDRRYAPPDPAMRAEARDIPAAPTASHLVSRWSALLAAPAAWYFAASRMQRPSGLSVVLLGPDGVGKIATLDAI